MILAACLAACGGPSSSNNQQQNPGIALKQRAFISNQLASAGLPSGQVLIVDAALDKVAFLITTGGVPSFMVLSPDKKLLLVFDTQNNSLLVIDNASETTVDSIALGDIARSIVMLNDNNTAVVALRNTGRVVFIDLGNRNVTATIGVPAVRTLILNHAANKAIALSDNTRDTVNIVDTSAKTATTIRSADFDFPTYAVFSSDDNKAYILSCGPECGGTTAKVSVLDVASGTVSQTIPVSAATIALLDGTNLYVAGTQGATGKLDVVNVSNMTRTTTGVTISDGFHQVMALGANSRLFIGARTCNNVTTGCLSIFNTGSNSATTDSPHGDVTGLQPITGRSVVYVIEGGELRIINTSNETEQTTPSIDVVGKAIDVKLVE